MSMITGRFSATIDQRTAVAENATAWRDTPSVDAVREAATRLESIRDTDLRKRKLSRAAEVQDVIDLLREDFR